MSDVEDNLEFYAAFEDELYKETSSVKSDDEIDSELEATLYQNVHFASSFVITPSKNTQEESDISEDPNLLESPAADGSGTELPNKVNCGSVNENEEQGISKYPEVQLVFANEKNKTKGSKVKDNASCILLNLDQTTDIDTEDGCKTSDGWELIAADLMPAFLKSKVKKRKSYIRCFNCNEKGHRTLQCTLPKKEKICSLCGTNGHLKQKCPNELCFNCHMPGHQVRQCRMPRCRYTDVCRRCHAFGHYQSSCPDKWRQYHFTIEPGKIISPKSIPNPEYEHVSCYNCGSEGHLGHECLEERSDGSFPSWYPFVVKYDKFTTDSPNKNQQNHGRQHIHFVGNKRRKLNDHREDEGQQGEYGGDSWNVPENHTGRLDPLENNEFTELPKCTTDVGYNRKKGKKKKNWKTVQQETVEDGNKNESRKSRRRKRKMEMKMQQINHNQDIEEDSLLNTWNMAAGTKKRNRNRKKNKIRNEAVEPSVDCHRVVSLEPTVDCHRVVTFKETLPASSEVKTKSRKNQKKRLNQSKSRKRTEPKKIHKPKTHQIPKDKQSRTVYFDYNGFV